MNKSLKNKDFSHEEADFFASDIGEYCYATHSANAIQKMQDGKVAPLKYLKL